MSREFSELEKRILERKIRELAEDILRENSYKELLEEYPQEALKDEDNKKDEEDDE